MIQRISQSDYLKMPWKNKQGVTLQILIEPAQSSIEQLNFEYRLSSAPIKQNCEFSRYPGFSRILLPIKGRGFVLNGKLFELHEVAHFDGDQSTHCDLVDGEVVDLGLVYNPLKVSAQVKVVSFKKEFILNSESDVVYIVYVLRGALQLNEVAALENETICVRDVSQIKFHSEKNCSVVLFTLRKLAV